MLALEVWVLFFGGGDVFFFFLHPKILYLGSNSIKSGVELPLLLQA